MKRKIFLVALMMSVLACLFAICANAAVVTDEIKHTYFPENAATESIDGIAAENHIHADVLNAHSDVVNARVRLNCKCAQGYHIYPTYYIASKDYSNKLVFNYTEINKQNPCGASYNKNTIVALEFPNGYSLFDAKPNDNNYGVRKSTSLEYVDMSEALTLTELSMASNSEPFVGCAALKYVKLPKTLTRIPAWSFIRCRELLIVDIPVDSQIEHIGTQAFKECNKLTALYLPDSIKTIGFLNDGTTYRDGKKDNDLGSEGDRKATFYNCTELFFVNNPEDTQKPTVYYMPASLEKVTGEIFKNLDKINDVIVFGEKFYCFNGGAGFAQINKPDNQPTTFVFKGSFAQEGARLEYSCEINYVNMYFTHPDIKDSSFIYYTTSWNGADPAGSYAYFCALGQKTTLDKQTYPNGTKVYQAKLDLISESNPHFIENENTGLYYENYFESGCVTDSCYCGKSIPRTEKTLDPVFVSLGISVTEANSLGSSVTQGFMVNKEALALLSKDVDYGFVFHANKNGTACSPLEAEGVISGSLIEAEYRCFDVKIVDIPADKADALLVFCAYLYVNGKYVYIDNGQTLDTVVGRSYNGLK